MTDRSGIWRLWLRAAVYLLIVGPVWMLGTALHEVGHAAAARAFGARVTCLNILWLRVYPGFGWDPTPDYYGYLGWVGNLTERQEAWVKVAGSGLTWLAAAAALGLWLARLSPRPGPLRALHLALTFLWLDVFTHTLPVIGMPQYLFFGRDRPQADVSELYYGARALGLPSALVLAAVFAYPAAAVALLVWRCQRGASQS